MFLPVYCRLNIGASTFDVALIVEGEEAARCLCSPARFAHPIDCPFIDCLSAPKVIGIPSEYPLSRYTDNYEIGKLHQFIALNITMYFPSKKQVLRRQEAQEQAQEAGALGRGAAARAPRRGTGSGRL